VDGFIVILIIAVIGFIGFTLLSYYFAEKRREQLSRWAASRGLSFDAAKDSSMEDRYPGFACLREGDDRYAYDIMQGADQKQTRSICAFDYHYETYSTDSKGNRQTHHYHFSAIVVDTGLPLRPLSIRSETFFDKIGEFLGHEDINLESAEFNRRFHVTSPDRRWAFDVLPQPTMEFLLESPRFALEIQNGCVLAYTKSTFSADEFESALGVVCGFLDRIPPSVLNELKST